MKSIKKRLIGLLGVILTVSGILISIPAGLNKDYLIFGVCLFLVIVGLTCIAMVME